MNAATTTKVFLGAGIAVVVAAVAGALIVLPAPSEERARRLDESRVEDLRGIARAMDLYWTRHGDLPATLADLASEPGMTIRSRDPETAQDYELRLLDASTYELCAGFERTSTPPGDAVDPAHAPSEDFWSHGAGRWCFQLDAQDVPSRESRSR